MKFDASDLFCDRKIASWGLALAYTRNSIRWPPARHHHDASRIRNAAKFIPPYRAASPRLSRAARAWVIRVTLALPAARATVDASITRRRLLSARAGRSACAKGAEWRGRMPGARAVGGIKQRGARNLKKGRAFGQRAVCPAAGLLDAPFFPSAPFRTRAPPSAPVKRRATRGDRTARLTARTQQATRAVPSHDHEARGERGAPAILELSTARARGAHTLQ